MPDVEPSLRWALLGLTLLACHYDPEVPEGVASCNETPDCPAGFDCRPKPQTDTKVCCRTASCGFLKGSADAAALTADAPVPRPDLAVDRGGTGGQTGGDAGPDLPMVAADAADGPAPDAPGDAPPAPPDLAPDLAPDAGGGCPVSKGGPALVRTGTFCTDSTEVTNQQYAAFLAAKGTDVAGQPTACKWNTSYVPSTDNVPWPYLVGRENHPVGNVDWCDAYMFCSWAGKRLCGRIGGGRLTSVSASTAAASSQWMNACSGGGRVSFPYGNTFAKSACNTDAPTSAAMYVEEVKHRPRCEGGYPGLFDMSGNLEEWIDACDANGGAADKCGIAGNASFIGALQPDDVTCSSSIFGEARNTRYYLLGFRCCAD